MSVSNSDSLISKKIDGYTIEKYINKGSYGSVYACSNSTGQKFAVKITSSIEKGIASLIEATIMTSYCHPYIVSAKDIIAKPEMFCIFMELAETDLLNCIRKRDLSLPEIKKYTHQILYAVASLHQQGIIHCDIKPNNILLYSDGNIKLADFSLSTLKISKNESFEYRICATNYRPPEVLKSERWNQAVDIWAMGCTFYELATGSVLVPNQCREDFIREFDRPFWYKVTLSAINKWRRSVNDSTAFNETIDVNPKNNIIIVNKWARVDQEFNRLVSWMLTYDHRMRPDCTLLLQHKYYEGSTSDMYYVNSAKQPTVNPIISKQIDAYFEKIKYSDPALIALTKEIYFRAANIPNNILKIDTSAWIASKLLTDRQISQDYLFSQLPHIIECERKICASLGYRLHVILPDQLTCIIKPYREFPLKQ